MGPREGSLCGKDGWETKETVSGSEAVRGRGRARAAGERLCVRVLRLGFLASLRASSCRSVSCPAVSTSPFF